MVDFTDEEMVILQKYEKHYSTALNAGYVSGFFGFNELYPIYQKYFKKRLSTGCNSCIMELLKKLGRNYYEQRLHIDEGTSEDCRNNG